MKVKHISIFFLIGFVNALSVLDAKQYDDKKYKFKITVPDQWSSTIRMDGTDKVYDFISPDKNAFVQVRSFKASKGLTISLLARVFEESYLPPGSVRKELLNKKSSNGIPGTIGTYVSKVNGTEVGISVFYVLQHGQGYVLTVMVPTSMFNAKQKEVSRILRSFTIPGYEIKTRNGSSAGGSANHDSQVAGRHNVMANKAPADRTIPPFTAVKISNVRLGDRLSGGRDVQNVSSRFGPQTENIYVVYDWEGEGAYGHKLTLTLVYKQNGRKIAQAVYKFPASRSQGINNAAFSRPAGGWPEGDYRVDFSIAGQIVYEAPFEILKKRTKTPEDVSSTGQNAEKTEETDNPVNEKDLFAGVQLKGSTERDERSASPKVNEKKPSSTKSNIDPFDISEQRKFWANVPISRGKWEKLPMKVSLMIQNLSSNRLSYKVYGAGMRKSSLYAPHTIQFTKSSKYTEKCTFNFIDNNRNYAVEGAEDIFSVYYYNSWACGRKGMILLSDNGGLTWKIQETPTREKIKSIHFANDSVGCAVGEHATILITQNGGNIWKKIESPVKGNLKRVVMTSTNIGYILVQRTSPLKGYVLKTTDGGQTWSVTSYESQFQTPIEMYGMSFIDNDNGWICGSFGLVFHTRNGGQSWEYQESARGASDNHSLNAIFQINSREGWACGNKGTLIYTKNGGNTWKEVDMGETNDFVALEFNGPYMGWVATSSKVYKYYDGQIDKYRRSFYKIFTERRVH